MSQSSAEVRETPLTSGTGATATGTSLYTSSKAKMDFRAKTDSKTKAESRTKTDSVDKANSRTKTDSMDKANSRTKTDSVDKANSRTKTDSMDKANSRTKTDSMDKANSRTKTDSISKIDSVGKTNSKSKTESQGKVDSRTKTNYSVTKPEAVEAMRETPKGSKTDSKSKSKSKTTDATQSKTDSANKVDEVAASASGNKTSTTHSRSKSKSDSGSKEDVNGDSDIAAESKKSTAVYSSGAGYPNSTGGKQQQQSSESQLKTETSSKPESLTNRLVIDSTSQPESANNVGITEDKKNTQSKSKSKSQSKSKSKTKLKTRTVSDDVLGTSQRGSVDSGNMGQLESSHNQESPAETAGENKESSPGPEAPPSSTPPPAAASPPAAPEETKSADPNAAGVPADASSPASKSPNKKGGAEIASVSNRSTVIPDDVNPYILPTKNNALYNTTAVLDKLDHYPSLKMRRDGKYYLKLKDTVIEQHPKVKRNKRGDVIPTIKKEVMAPIERIVSRFCEDVLCISRAQFLPLTSQGERHLVWVGKKKANHIIRYLNGNGCYVVNRFPGDIFVKDKQVMGIILREHMLMRSNHCYWKCGVPKEDILNFLNPKQENEEEEENPITYRICRHMVKTMQIDEDGCEDKGCFNYEKQTCKHLDIFIPEVQSFCTYNALQDFSNRLEDDLKGQTFICKPAYLYKGYGFRFFRTAAEFQEFYHITEGKETSRHDFMVQRLVDKPFLFNEKKVDIRAFLLVIVLRYRRVISFIHYGFCRVASLEFELEEEEDEVKVDEPMTDKELAKKQAESYEKDMKMFVCTYQTAEEKNDRNKRMESRTFYDEAEDRSQELQAVFPKDEELDGIKEQIRHIGLRISQAIENKVWDAFGCFQIFGLDLCVDEDMKVWLIEVNSHAMSQVDTLSPTQRKVVPAVIMESLGLVVETTYKSFHHLRLRKSPTNEFEETGFLFRQNFEFIFSTLAKKRIDYVWPKPPKKPNLPFWERIGQVDEQIKMVEKRKKACLAMKIAVREEQLALKRKRNAKDEEES